MVHTVYVADFLHLHYHLGHLLARLALDPYCVHRSTRFCVANEAARVHFLQRLLYVDCILLSH
jgi:hypothetical protein